MTRPRLLDLFCGAGGCSVGYSRAGFDVTGVDLYPQPRYPFMDVIQGDALAVLDDASLLDEFDVIHASPPCQAYSALANRWPDRHHVELVEHVICLLDQGGYTYVVENVIGAPMPPDALLLCGSMFGLGSGDAVLRRHRLFASSVPLVPPGPCACAGRPTVGVYGSGGAWTRTAPGGGGVKVAGADAAAAMGVDWGLSHQPSLAQLIPPAYTEWIGRQLMAHITEEA